MEVSDNLLKKIFEYMFVYVESETHSDWVWNDSVGDIVESLKTEKTYFLDYGEESCEISLAEYLEFIRIEKSLNLSRPIFH